MLDLCGVNAELPGEQARKDSRMSLAGRLHVASEDELLAAGK